MSEKNRAGRPSKKRIRIIETGKVVTGYAAAAREVKGNRGCVYLCLSDYSDRKKHKGYSFEFVN